MKHEWYECRVKYEKTLDTGEKKKVTEAYVVKAVSLSDAEKRIIEELKPNIVGEFAATSAKVASFKEIVQSDEDKFYLCKVVFLSFDEDSGTEKKTNHSVLIQAEDFDDARKRLDSCMKGTVSDWEVFSITESPIIGVV